MYGNYEVVVYGGGETYRDVFNAVALMAGTGPLDSLVRVVLLLGLMLLISKAVFDYNVGSLLRWFLMATVIYGVIWIPKVQIHVTDKFNVALAGADIANVPLGIAFVAATSSEVGDTFIRLTETSFADPAGLAYSQSGMIYGAKIFGALNGLRIIDPALAQSMQAYIHDCIADDIIANTIDLNQVETTTDLWAFLRSNYNPAYSTTVWADGSAPVVATCAAAAGDIDAMWTGEIANNIANAQVRMNAGTILGSTTSLATGGDSIAAAAIPGSSTISLFKQALTITALQQSTATYAALANGSNTLSNFATLQAGNQNNATSGQVGAMAQKMIPILQVVMTVLFIGMFPIMAPAFLLPGFGPRMLQGYFSGFIYLQLWGPMYVILNKIFLYQTIENTTAAVTSSVGGTSSVGLTFANLASTSSANQNLANVAGMMMMSIPVLAAALTKGAMDAGGHAFSTLGAARGAAEMAGSMQATGNVSMGNTAIDNVQFDNASAHQITTSPMIDRGRFSSYDAGGNLVTTSADGTQIFKAANSDPNFQIKASDGIRKVASSEATQYRDAQTAVNNTWSEGKSRAAASITEASNAWSKGSDYRSTVGTDDRNSVGQVIQTMDQVADHLRKTSGLTVGDVKSATGRAAAEVYGGAEGGVGLKALGTGAAAKAGGRLSYTVSGDEAHNVAYNKAVQAARDELHSRNFSDKVEAAQSHFATQVYGSTSSTTTGGRLVNSDTFTSSKSVNDTLSKLESEGKRWSSTESFAEHQGFDHDTNLTNAAVNYLARTPVYDAYGQQLSVGQLLNPVGPDAQRINELREAALAPFYQQYAEGLQPGPAIAATRTAPLELRNPGQFELGGTSPESGSVSAGAGQTPIVTDSNARRRRIADAEPNPGPAFAPIRPLSEPQDLRAAGSHASASGRLANDDTKVGMSGDLYSWSVTNPLGTSNNAFAGRGAGGEARALSRAEGRKPTPEQQQQSKTGETRLRSRNRVGDAD